MNNSSGKIINEKAVSTNEVRILAVGGSKGGIGKSIFASNIAVYLSSLGKKTVLIDLDLGGANAHLYLGLTSLKRCINDYLSNRVSSLKSLVCHTDYGPLFIGGDSSRLGSSNVGFRGKMRLLQAIRKIEADCVVLDLGAGTSYNTLDFFLSADMAIVMSTCSPASYLSAYNLIKVALCRRLERLFGNEYAPRAKKNVELEMLIRSFTSPPGVSKIENITRLFEVIKREHPDYLHEIEVILQNYVPCLVVNRSRKEAEAYEIVKRIQDVSRRVLSVSVSYAGRVPESQEAEKSAKELVPVMVRNSKCEFARATADVVDKVLSRTETILS